MNILNILNDKELSDIPILYILRVIHSVQKEIQNEQSSNVREELHRHNESVKKR